MYMRQKVHKLEKMLAQFQNSLAQKSSSDVGQKSNFTSKLEIAHHLVPTNIFSGAAGFCEYYDLNQFVPDQWSVLLHKNRQSLFKSRIFPLIPTSRDFFLQFHSLVEDRANDFKLTSNERERVRNKAARPVTDMRTLPSYRHCYTLAQRYFVHSILFFFLFIYSLMVLSSYVKLADCERVFYVVLLQIETHKRALAYECALALFKIEFKSILTVFSEWRRKRARHLIWLPSNRRLCQHRRFSSTTHWNILCIPTELMLMGCLRTFPFHT